MLKNNLYPFAAVVGQEEAKKALLIALVNRRAGGLLIGGAKGTAKIRAGPQCAEFDWCAKDADVAAECNRGYAFWQH